MGNPSASHSGGSGWGIKIKNKGGCMTTDFAKPTAPIINDVSGPGGIFCFSVICNDRLSKLVAQQNNNDSTFWNLPNADNLLVRLIGNNQVEN